MARWQLLRQRISWRIRLNSGDGSRLKSSQHHRKMPPSCSTSQVWSVRARECTDSTNHLQGCLRWAVSRCQQLIGRVAEVVRDRGECGAGRGSTSTIESDLYFR